jgi:hypothetical protein
MGKGVGLVHGCPPALLLFFRRRQQGLGRNQQIDHVKKKDPQEL